MPPNNALLRRPGLHLSVFRAFCPGLAELGSLGRFTRMETSTPIQSVQVSRRAFLLHLAGSAFAGFLGLFFGAVAVSHKCYDDIPLWSVSIQIFGAVSFGYAWYKIPRWYFRVPALVVLYFVVSALDDHYIRTAHNHT